jgi:hypothetical protein
MHSARGRGSAGKQHAHMCAHTSSRAPGAAKERRRPLASCAGARTPGRTRVTAVLARTTHARTHKQPPRTKELAVVQVPERGLPGPALPHHDAKGVDVHGCTCAGGKRSVCACAYVCVCVGGGRVRCRCNARLVKHDHRDGHKHGCMGARLSCACMTRHPTGRGGPRLGWPAAADTPPSPPGHHHHHHHHHAPPQPPLPRPTPQPHHAPRAP